MSENTGHYLIKTLDFQGEAAELLRPLAQEPYLVWLDSNHAGASQGRYSFIGFDPFEVFSSQTSKDTLSVLRQKYQRLVCAEKGLPTPLPAGLIGYLSYDYGLYQEGIALRPKESSGLPQAVFGFYDCILTIDHWQQKLHLSSSGLPETDPLLRRKRARERLSWMEKKIAAYVPQKAITPKDTLLVPSDISLGLVSNISRPQYDAAVRRALEHIGRGDIYQVNLSQRFAFDPPMKVDPWEVYTLLRRLSPSSFGGYMDAGDFQILSNSPEDFLHLSNGSVRTRPMKGTRPRGRSAEEDLRWRKDIEENVKEKAELLMITDLERNDLGKVCRYGSVHVRHMRTIEEYPYVFQATSSVEGALRADKDCFDLIRACFPGGSITGCPKIRAMEIIEELEPVRRGIYTGSLGYVSFSGDAGFNILIRTLVYHRGKFYFHVGGGVVADSTPEGEYVETLVKAQAMRVCLERVFGSQPAFRS